MLLHMSVEYIYIMCTGSYNEEDKKVIYNVWR
jgi:hypothetical protein